MSSPPYRYGLAALAFVLTAAVGCSTSPPARDRRVVAAVASISAWGSIVAQLGGSHVHAISIVRNPNADPHDYEPTPADGRAIARAQLFVENGVGYDSWAAKALAASPDPRRAVINVGELVGVPKGGNPHRWYDPADVHAVASAVTADLIKLDPADADYFTARHTQFAHALAPYDQLIAQLRTAYAGVPIGASESVFAPMADSLGLTLLTPPTFLRAISEGTEPSAADKATIDDQIAKRAIKVYVYNSQNATPDVALQVAAARAAGIPVVPVTETLTPASATFQDWQVAQLRALQAALATVSLPAS